MAKLTGVPFYPADPSNYSVGRERAIRFITVHHSAGWENTLRYLWANPSRNGSSHFWVGNQPGQMEQYVDTKDTAWTNSNWSSNNESITIETRGDWRGYYDAQTLTNLRALIKKILQTHPGLGLTFHMDVSSTGTLCPADLKHKGYAKAQFDAAVVDLTPPPPPPAAPSITYQAIAPKRIKLKIATNLWNFNFTDWSKVQAIQPYGAGSVIDVVAVATNALGAKYYMTAYSYNGGSIRATNGFNIKDCEDYVPPVPPTPVPPAQPPVVEPKWEAMATPRKMRLASDTYVHDLDTGKDIGSLIFAGTDVDLVEKKTDKNNVVWVRSKWAKENNKNWGMKLNLFAEIPAPTPEPPVEPTPEPPLDVDPTVPGNGDYIAQINWLVKAVKAILAFFKINI